MCPHKKFNELAAQQAHQADPLRLVAALPRSRAAYAQIVGWRGAAERPWTLPGEARVEVSQLYPSRVQSVGHSSSGAVRLPAVWVAAQHRFKTDAASLSAIGGETCAKGSALEGETPHPPRGLSRGVGRRGATERTWTLPGEARAEVSQLYPSRVQSMGHSTGRAHQAPAVWVAAQQCFKPDAAIAAGQRRGNTREQVCSRRSGVASAARLKLGRWAACSKSMRWGQA